MAGPQFFGKRLVKLTHPFFGIGPGGTIDAGKSVAAQGALQAAA
jgi:hypothetical protein